MLTRNVATRCGLINEPFGTVKAFICKPREKLTTLQESIIVQFPTFKRSSCLPDLGKCVGIRPETAEWFFGEERDSRTQFPLKLAWAVTIHNSQGITLDKIVSDSSNAGFASALHFVALSTVQSAQDLLIVPFDWDSVKR